MKCTINATRRHLELSPYCYVGPLRLTPAANFLISSSLSQANAVCALQPREAINKRPRKRYMCIYRDGGLNLFYI